MHWNEKIDLIKKKYAEEEFSVPHLKRKDILRNIETKFIKRSKDYYDLNNSNERFSNWWNNIISTKEDSIDYKMNPISEIERLINSKEPYWIAPEFLNGIMIYKAKKNAILDLISVGRTLSETYHLIHLKYDFIISFKIESSYIIVRRGFKK